MYYFHFQINWYNLLQKYAEGSEVVMKNAHPLNIDINYLISLCEIIRRTPSIVIGM